MLKIGKIIAARLEQKNLTQKAAADQLNINPKTFSTYVNDTCYPPLDVLRDICQLLDIDLNHLLGLHDHGNLDLLIQGKDEARVCQTIRSLNKDENIFYMQGIDFLDKALKHMRKDKQK
ncbi:helix-turn-helix domain-containing protein [Candidatus Stoquefichus sp. SB1]|jgi:transcriptional regulator with XRE-family HTH domain|uniref:helix-turn-helix domain-containing protein n=1 Tax=Candidatus Stoquefichus sp. SB1 TaxID=1658109 RepID=UPI00067F4CEB|nr:helix-turn-helix transcriptional regulator [Candidatus Stoquefichus sp. SB1]